MEFFNGNNLHLSIAIVLSAINAVMMCFIGSKFLQVIQLSGYKIKGFRAWLQDTKAKYVGRIVMLTFLSLACVLVTNALLSGYGEYYSYVGLIFYFYFSIVFIINLFRLPQKTPLKQTKRMNRLTITVFLVMGTITFFLIAVFSEYVPFVKFGIVAITPLLTTFVVPLCHLICVPIEALFRQVYITKAKKKLKKQPDLIKIGITGSYGKTTTKHILNVMLGKKYNVCMSPHSFNTPMGLTKVINSYLKPEHQVLITEMGARQQGDVAYLCRMIKPKHAIITGVSNQHLATFRTIENVYKAKKELVDAITDGIICFNSNNQWSKKMYDECNKNKLLCGLEDAENFVNISNIQTTCTGSTFDLTIESKTVSCTTKLLGKHNIEDIAVSAGIAYKLGLKLSEIKSAIASLKPVAHRMEIINENDYIIIDNSYNASVESSKASLETLKLFNGNKIIVTPGLVELGEEEYKANVDLGYQISQVANKVIIVNQTNKQAIDEGLRKGNFELENIIYVESLNDAKDKLKEIIKSGDVILFENDLPDNYI
ncbi:MAG: UDP-N-acetylmuramoyl-tripeptide--D-alanyl-D-alanine ligase [Clostridia bacterium]|nr:UDP-N-acetylmuramoyl-tripeptide--D-alanyl-D-alanine ligase [Clostridia bacterium]